MSHLPGAFAGALRRPGLAALTAHTYRRCQAFSGGYLMCARIRRNADIGITPIRCAAASTSAGRQRVDMRANIAEYLRPFSVGWTAVVSAGGYRLQARVSVVTGVEASRGRHAGT